MDYVLVARTNKDCSGEAKFGFVEVGLCLIIPCLVASFDENRRFQSKEMGMVIHCGRQILLKVRLISFMDIV